MRKFYAFCISYCCFSSLFAQTFPQISTVGPAHPRDLSAQMLNVQEGYILTFLDSTRTNTQLYYTNDIAATWTPRAMRGLPETGTGNHLGVHFYTPQLGIYLTQNRIFRTVNGGDDWVQVLQPFGTYTMCHFGDTTYVVGSNGYYYRSYDAGQNWTSRSWNSGSPLILGCACDETEVSMWGLPSVSAFSQPAVRMSHGEISIFNYLIDANKALMDNRGFAQYYRAFSAREIYRYWFGAVAITTDGGVSYNNPVQATPGPMGTENYFHWVDKQHGFKVVGDRIYQTSDAADNWHLLWQHAELTAFPAHVFSSPAGNYVHVAVLRGADSNGVRLLDVVTNTGFLALSDRGKMEQAQLVVYPNPASTNIRFSGLPADELYELKLSDISGRQLLQLPNWEISTELDVSGLQQGIYLYQLKSKSGYHTGRFIKQ